MRLEVIPEDFSQKYVFFAYKVFSIGLKTLINSTELKLTNNKYELFFFAEDSYIKRSLVV